MDNGYYGAKGRTKRQTFFDTNPMEINLALVNHEDVNLAQKIGNLTPDKKKAIKNLQKVPNPL